MRHFNRINQSMAICAVLVSPLIAQVNHVGNYYNFMETGKAIRLWVPNAAGPVKGIFVNGNAGTGDFRGWCENVQFQQYATMWDFGMLATSGFDGRYSYTNGDCDLLKRALDSFAGMNVHPELMHVPFVTLGNSSAGGFGYAVACKFPSRTICFAVNVPWAINPETPPDAALSVPGMILAGNADNNATADNQYSYFMQSARSRGALWSGIVLQMGHEHRRTMHILYPFIEKCIRWRLPRDADAKTGPVVLKNFTIEQGWLGDESTWAGGFTVVKPYGEFTGDKSLCSWLPDKEIAFLYEGYSSYNQKVFVRTKDTLSWTAFLTNTDMELHKPGDKIELLCNTTVSGWTSIEYYYSDRKIAERKPGEPTSLTVTLAYDAYAQPFSVIVRGTNGAAFHSHMYTVLVIDETRPIATATAHSRYRTNASVPVYKNGVKRSTDLLGRYYDVAIDNRHRKVRTMRVGDSQQR